jgi:hypothetical protein
VSTSYKYRLVVSSGTHDLPVSRVALLTAKAMYPDSTPLPPFEVVGIAKVSDDGRGPLDRRLLKFLEIKDDSFPMSIEQWESIQSKFNSCSKKLSWKIEPHFHNPNRTTETQRSIVEREHGSELCKMLVAGDVTARFSYSNLPVERHFLFEKSIRNDPYQQIVLPRNEFIKFAAGLGIEVVIEDVPEAVAVSSKTAKVTDKGQPWTDERLRLIAAYRAKNGTQKAAEYFGISTALIRKKLPNEKPNKSNSSAFGNMTKTLKRKG